MNKAVSFPFKTGVTFSYSKDVDSLPVIKIVVDRAPCADPYQQTNAVSYPSERESEQACIEEPNTRLKNSPTYKVAGTGWSTNEWAVEQENLIG